MDELRKRVPFKLPSDEVNPEDDEQHVMDEQGMSFHHCRCDAPLTRCLGAEQQELIHTLEEEAKQSEKFNINALRVILGFSILL